MSEDDVQVIGVEWKNGQDCARASRFALTFLEIP